jgi:hypothetical protein
VLAALVVIQAGLILYLDLTAFLVQLPLQEAVTEGTLPLAVQAVAEALEAEVAVQVLLVLELLVKVLQEAQAIPVKQVAAAVVLAQLVARRLLRQAALEPLEFRQA